MADSFEEVWKQAQHEAGVLRAFIESEKYPAHGLAQSLSEFRSQCENVIFRDFGFAATHAIEDTLWDIHDIFNKSFRRQLRYYGKADGRRKPVERRKAERHYLNFIKSSQRFYRDYIQRLASYFGGIKELDAVAKCLMLSTLAANEPTHSSDTMGRLVLLSCYQTLIRLGDLSRWRETQLATKIRNWGPAIGYYELADRIYPNSGTSHNQMAVIAQNEGNSFDIIYHLYRALAVPESCLGARTNLQIHFKKIMDATDMGELQNNASIEDNKNLRERLISSFLKLHARYYTDPDANYTAFEASFFAQLKHALNARRLEKTITRAIFVNLAAEYYAGALYRGLNTNPNGIPKLTINQEDPSCTKLIQSLLAMIRLNMRFLYELLQILQSELHTPQSNDEKNLGYCQQRGLSTKVRRVIPWIRQYSAWLLPQAAILAGGTIDDSLNSQAIELGNLYAQILNQLKVSFNLTNRLSIGYLLEEDGDAIGFVPLDTTGPDHIRQRYYLKDLHTRKPHRHIRGINQSCSTNEMLSRIQDIISDGEYLITQQDVPLQLDEKHKFTYENLSSKMAQSSQHLQNVTHISETKLLSSAVVADEDVIRVTCPIESESQPISIGSSLPVIKGLDHEDASQATSHHNILSQQEETSYGLIPSAEFRNLFDSAPQVTLSERSTISEMPDASCSTPRRITNPLHLLHQRQRSRGQNIMVDNVVRSSPWFTESSHDNPSLLMSPPPA